MKRLTETQVIANVKELWKKWQDSYIAALEANSEFGKGRMTDEEKQKALEFHIIRSFGRPYTLDDAIKDALQEYRKRSTMSDSKLKKRMMDMKKKSDENFTGDGNVA